MSEDDLSEDTNGGADGEGVWSPDIEQSFQEALQMYPPCGRRKIIINDDTGGKMYGRNELIARYIKMRTGKTRSRKQVSSHIQVLARRKAKEVTAATSGPNSAGAVAVGAVVNNVANNNNSNNNHNGNNNNNGNNTSTALITTTTNTQNHHHLQDHHTPPQHTTPQHTPPQLTPPHLTPPPHHAPIHHHLSHHHLPHHIFHPHHQNQNNFSSNNNNNNINNNNNHYHHHLNNNTATIANTLISNNLINHHNHNNHHHHLHHDDIILSRMGPTASYIGSQKLRLVEFSAFMNSHNHHYHQHRNQNDNGNSMIMYPAHNGHNGHHHTNHLHHYNHNNHHHQSLSPLPSSHLHAQIANEHNNDNHFFVHINQRTQTIQSETIDIAQILDKFPNEDGGLKDLYDQGPKDAFFLVKCWGDLNKHELDEQNSFYGFSSHFESNEEMSIFCSTKVCSFGKVAAELDDKQKAVCKNGRYSYYFQPQPMCNYMVEFIRKLRDLPKTDLMNSVLENFTILKVVKDHATRETLLCIAFIFEVSQKNGATHNIYKLKGT